MLKMRLQRRGKKNYATYRVVVADSRAPIQGKFVADLGHYNPHTNTFAVNGQEVTEWLSKGVQATPTVYNQLVEHKVIDGEKVLAWKPKKKEGEEAEEATASEAAAPEASASEATPETEKGEDTASETKSE